MKTKKKKKKKNVGWGDHSVWSRDLPPFFGTRANVPSSATWAIPMASADSPPTRCGIAWMSRGPRSDMTIDAKRMSHGACHMVHDRCM